MKAANMVLYLQDMCSGLIFVVKDTFLTVGFSMRFDLAFDIFSWWLDTCMKVNNAKG